MWDFKKPPQRTGWWKDLWIILQTGDCSRRIHQNRFPMFSPRCRPGSGDAVPLRKRYFWYNGDVLPFFAWAVWCCSFGFTPKLFWRCPCCGHSFPYYVPTRGDNLREKECLMAIEGLHIKYVKRKLCPLIIPSVCPECRCQFFEMADEFPVRDWRSKSGWKYNCWYYYKAGV